MSMVMGFIRRSRCVVCSAGHRSAKAPIRCGGSTKPAETGLRVGERAA